MTRPNDDGIYQLLDLALLAMFDDLCHAVTMLEVRPEEADIGLLRHRVTQAFDKLNKVRQALGSLEDK